MSAPRLFSQSLGSISCARGRSLGNVSCLRWEVDMRSSSDIRMVDVGKKPVTKRQAVARGRVLMQAKTLGMLKKGKLPKGDVLAAARVAGLMAAKKTYRLFPLCHPLLI